MDLNSSRNSLDSHFSLIPKQAQSAGAVEYTVRPPANDCSVFVTKLSDSEAPIMLEL